MSETSSGNAAFPAVRRSAMVFIFITVLVDTIGFGIILPVTPKLIVELTGSSLSDAAIYGGWLAFVFALAQFFFAPVLGNLSDRFGRRPVLLLSLLAFGLDYTLMGFAPTLGWLFVGRAIAGLAGAAFTPAYAYLADVSPPEKRAQNFGLMGVAFGLGFILGPAAGGLLGSLGTRAPFFAAAALAFLNLAFGFFALSESLPRHARRPFSWARAHPLGTLRQLRKYPGIPALMGALFLWQLGHQVLPSTWSFYSMLKFGWSEGAVGASLAAVGVIMAISQGALTRVVIPRLGEARSGLAALCCGALGFFVYAFATRGWMIYAGMLTWFMAALAYPSLNGLMSRQVPVDAQGELQGGLASQFSLTSLLGPPLMTQLFGHFSRAGAAVYFPGAAFLVAGLLAIGAALLLWRTRASFAAAPAALET